MTPNDPKLSDRGVRRGTCMVGGKAAVEAGAVTHGAVRCSAWLAVIVVGYSVAAILVISSGPRSVSYIWASVIRSTVGHAPRHAPPSLSLGSLGASAHLL